MGDQRKHLRLPIKLDAEMTRPDGSIHPGVTENISFGGVLLAFATAPTAVSGEQCKVSLLLQERTLSLDIQCRVIHCTGNGIGFQFERISLEHYEHFKNIMVLHSPDPEQLLDELKRRPGLTIAKA